MSMEICPMCNQESTPWFKVNGHICQDCYLNSKVTHWINVKDKLPLYKQVVLVYLDSGTITEAVYRGEYENDQHIFRIELTREDTGERVTHWMDLPEPPNDN